MIGKYPRRVQLRGFYFEIGTQPARAVQHESDVQCNLNFAS
jgi:hypothetical protein